MRKFITLLLFFTLAASAFELDKSKWHAGFGLVTNNETTLNLLVESRYDWATFRIEGFVFSKNDNDEWMNVRGILAYRFFSDLPYSVDAGFSVGYLYAKAPNKHHKSINAANNTKFLWEYNLREYIDYSAIMSARLYGLQAEIIIPVVYQRNTVKPTPLWTLGYVFEL